jgi:hypothetical protein
MTTLRLQAALLAGVFIGILSELPVLKHGNACCCLRVISGGALAAYLLQQNQTLPITVADGAGVGFLAGMFGAVLSLPIRLALGPVDQRVMERMGEFVGNSPDVPPEMLQLIEEVGSSPVGILVSFVVFLAIAMVFATIGGVLGAAVFRKTPPPSASTSAASDSGA